MTWATALAEKAAAEAAAFGEATDVTPAGSVDPVRVAAVWGPLELSDLGQGFVADVTTVYIPVAALVQYGSAVVPARGDELTRYPDDYSPDLRETWQVETVRRPDPHVWELDVLKAPRPVPGA